MRFDIITIFPKILDSYLNESILKRAQKKGLIKINTHNLRDFTIDKHRKVDDTPYGGGPGMVFKAEPIVKAVAKIKSKNKSRVILFSLRGEKFNQKTAHRLAQYSQLIFICGRYEGVDERVAKYVADEEISIGDFVLSGGELPAAMVIEAVSRLVPGVLGKFDSLEELKGTYPAYTKPEIAEIKGKKRYAPKILLSGDHKKINEWRTKQS
ncbi:MAG: tRNA (guanine37-N1)-methyltransferase [Parcubacteria group bacterium Athens0714_26]|nr:MAG: tRNA (guanine37-N1)-methyltransferase [Parcubacteria group bacterium Athens1014_26]TSD03253.1 MAG: tRNA (guanine37-N1)-methyltransferase [Parcubacteria group bacterium Athens0714_26]